MRHLLTIALLAISVYALGATKDEVKAAIPAKEGVVNLVVEEVGLWRNMPARTYGGLLDSCIFCQKAQGSLAITKDAIFFVVGGKPTFKLKRADMEAIETEKYGRSRLIFITSPNYDVTLIQVFGQEAVQPIVDELKIQWVDN